MPRSLDIKVVLPSNTAVAGDTIKAHAIVTNSSSKAIYATGCPREWLEVGLTGQGHTFENSSELMVCPPTVRFPPGQSVFPVSIETRYDSCGETESSPGSPRCVGPNHDQEPNLRRGSYRVDVFYDFALQPPQSPPLTVTLISAPQDEGFMGTPST